MKIFFKLQNGHKITIVEFQRRITSKMYRQEMKFLCSAPCLMMLYISTKFHENILNGIQVIERTQNCHCQISKGNNFKMYRQELQFLWSAHHLIILYMSMKFHENILNGFQVIEGTQNFHCRISIGNNSKNVLTIVTVLVLCTSSNDVSYFYEVHQNVLNGFRVTEQTRNYHCQISKGNNSKNV